ncbi:MAG: TonB-dependent receptor [Bacteroidales bacterium]|nr:TonB-dependent receptor [Bacteroidales bacterium]
MVKNLFTKLCLIMSIILLSIMTGYAQSGKVSGTVTDASSGQTLPGVTILIKGTTIGTTTDLNGTYTIKVDPDAVLVFSYVGFQTQEIAVQPGTTVNIVLEVGLAELDEFVVIGYGVQKKEDLTGSITAVDSRDFNVGAITAPTDLITGKIAGVQITNGGGAPGSETTIRIRGGASIRASNDPLIVIDGVPVDKEGISGMRNPLNSINPNDIETFTVLKDASATAIYGSRASNGVIIITTKKGAVGDGKGKTISLNYSGSYSMYTIPKKVDVLNASEYESLIKEQFDGNDNVLGLLGTESTNWQDQIYDNASGMDHYLSATGAFRFLPYRVSYGYSDHDGILKTDNLKRHTISANLNPKFFDDHLQVNINTRYMKIKNRFADRGAIGGALQFDPTQPVFDSESPYGGYYTWVDGDGLPKPTATTNPVALLDMREDKSDVNRFVGNAQLDYKFHFFPDLRANLNLGTDRSNSDGTIYVPENAPWSFDAEKGGGVDRVYSQEKRNELLDFYLNYTKQVESIQSNFDVMGGYSWQHFKLEDRAFETNINKADTVADTYNPREFYLVSLFGRINYAFKNRYLVTATLRNDNTSRFHKDHRAGWFPAVGLGWKIVDEPWMQNVKFFSQLKLRAGWGITGQQDISEDYYPYLARYTLSELNAQYQFDSTFIQTYRPGGYDEFIKWEETTTWNFGLDYGFANDRFYGTLDFYFRKTKDLINSIPVSAGSNLTNFIITNVGDMENRGVEFTITTKPIVKDDLWWSVSFNATYNENEITKLTAYDDPEYQGIPTGGISGAIGNHIQMQTVGHPSSSFYVFEQVYDANGNPIEGLYVDRDGDGEITDFDKYHFNSPDPSFYFGISSILTYKNWEFSFAGRAQFGRYVFNNISAENGNYQRLFRPEGPYLSNVTSDIYQAGFVNPQYYTNYYIQDGSFFKMDNIRLSYLFTDLFKDKVSLGVSATVNNAFTITKYDGIDPEIDNGIDNRIYPRPRIYVLGLNLVF